MAGRGALVLPACSARGAVRGVHHGLGRALVREQLPDLRRRAGRGLLCGPHLLAGDGPRCGRGRGGNDAQRQCHEESDTAQPPDPVHDQKIDVCAELLEPQPPAPPPQKWPFLRGGAAWVAWRSVLVLLPPVGDQAPGGDGAPLDLGALSAAELTPQRAELTDALVTLAADVPGRGGRSGSHRDRTTRSPATRACGPARPFPPCSATPASSTTRSTSPR